MTIISNMGKFIDLDLTYFQLTQTFFSALVCRLGLDMSQRVLKQRINDIEQEYERKYINAKEQLKLDARLTVDTIVCLDEKTQ